MVYLTITFFLLPCEIYRAIAPSDYLAQCLVDAEERRFCRFKRKKICVFRVTRRPEFESQNLRSWQAVRFAKQIVPPPPRNHGATGSTA